MELYEILWKDQVHGINKCEKWVKISKNKAYLYLSNNFKNPILYKSKIIDLRAGAIIETSRFKIRLTWLLPLPTSYVQEYLNMGYKLTPLSGGVYKIQSLPDDKKDKIKRALAVPFFIKDILEQYSNFYKERERGL